MTSKRLHGIGSQFARAFLVFAAFVASALTIVPAFAQTSGSWNVSASGTWSVSSNWLNGIIADGSGGTANFANNITTNTTVTLDSARTIGNLNFSDAGVSGSTWVLSGSNILTLAASGVPSIVTATNTTISVQLAGTNGFNKSGSQLLILTGANTYSGTTTISAGTLRAIDGVGLSTGSNLTLAGGVLELSGTFTRNLGTTAGQVGWTGSGGFSAQGGNLVVQLNGNTNAVTWGSGNFVPEGASLQFGSTSATALVNFQNAIDLGGATRTVSVTDNGISSQDVAQLSGMLSNGGVIKAGTGTLFLSAANNYSGLTTIIAGALRAVDGVGLPTGSNLTLAGGVLESSGTFSRSFGTGANQVQWTADGGFSAQGGNLVVQLNGNTNAVTWGSGSFVPNGSSLVLSSLTADALVDFRNAIDLGGATRSISVSDNFITSADLAQLSGVLANGGLTKAGTGALILIGANTYSGVTTISAGVLRAVDGVGLPTGSNLTLAGGVLESSGTFSRGLGTAVGQVQWATTSGFSAQGGNLVVQLNGNTNAVIWGSASFVPLGSQLLFGSVTADALVDFQNAIDLGGLSRTVSVTENPVINTDSAQISGVLSNGGITKTGTGTLVLTGANTYSGVTTVSGGTLRAIDGIGLPTGSNLTLVGSVLESRGTFSRSLGTGAGQIQWTSSGGFAAQGGNLVVQLNGNTNAVTWASGNFVAATFALLLGSTTADALIDFQNAIDLAGGIRSVSVADTTGTNADLAQLSGVLSNGGLSKFGAGTLVLTGANTYSGVTIVSVGALRAIDGVGLPAGSNLSLGGGVLESSGTLSRSLGNGAGLVQWTNTGGFSAQGGNLVVRLNGNTNAVTWGSGNFVPVGSQLLFGSVTADALVDFQNAIDLAGATRTVSVTDNVFTTADSVRLSGVISNGGLTKFGTGLLELTAANTYSGVTTISSSGTLRAIDGVGLPTASNLTLAGGVLESSGTFSRNLGTGAGQVQWTGSSGFSAQGSNLVVQLNGNTNIVTWGSGSFVPAGTSLLFSTLTADALVDFQNAIDLGGATRTISVRNNVNSSTDLALLSGVLSNGGLAKTGTGTLVLAGANTYSGTTDVNGGTLSVTGSTGFGKTTIATSGLLNGTGAVAGTLEINSGGALSAGLGNGVKSNGVGRLNSTATGGTTVAWKTDANVVFDFSAASTSTAAESTPGTNWDYLSIAGVLDLQPGLGKINLYINSWNGTTGYGQNSNGQPADDFDKSNAAVAGNVQGRDYAYVWIWATTGGTIMVDGIEITGPTDLSDRFNVITDQANASYGNGVFSGSPSYTPNSLGGQFWVSAIGNKLYVNYSSVPEPSSLLLIGLAGFGLGAYRRRKNRQAAKTPE